MNLLLKIYHFYIEGFKSMTIGRKLWAIIIIKCIVLFCVLRLFFFPNVLEENYATDSERAQAVRQALTANPE